jgi:hypothetical protein
LSVADQAAGEFEQCFVDVGAALPADAQATEACSHAKLLSTTQR